MGLNDGILDFEGRSPVCVAQKLGFNIGTCSIDSNSIECEIYVTKHHFLIWYTIATNKNYTILSGKNAHNILEGHLTYLYFRRKPQTLRMSTLSSLLLINDHWVAKVVHYNILKMKM
ncbi:hypothetical protein MTR_2g099985 [Medicago truncatula]|uniref:Uncharacterized protein n=1 Tax=Medicago truncatula TaxID=3880 RepID=A0A072VD39_MEDTR|nr:hypothetical protein MTR_2g099985 [Medicago truncatula]